MGYFNIYSSSMCQAECGDSIRRGDKLAVLNTSYNLGRKANTLKGRIWGITGVWRAPHLSLWD